MSTTLNSGSLLQGGRYRIERVLGQGGFGITYLATHTGFDQKVALKEFYMKELCVRNEETSFVTLGTGESSATVERFRGKFLKEARNLFRLNHKHIVRVLDIFEENGTAYFAMEYAEGGSLSQKVKAEGALSESVATRYILQVAEALAYLHEQKMNHLDVKPANIMLSAKDDVVLIDFGLAKQYDATGGQTSTTPAGISEGYAPMEQYKLGGVSEFTPETDIYALGATFFKLLTGVTPPSAQDVFEDGVPVETLRQHGVSEAAVSVIERAMKPSKKARMNSVKAFIEVLNGPFVEEGSRPAVEVRPFDDEKTRVVEPPKKDAEPVEAIILEPEKTSVLGKIYKAMTVGLGVAFVLFLISNAALNFCYSQDCPNYDVGETLEVIQLIISYFIPIYWVNALVLFCYIARKRSTYGVSLSTQKLTIAISFLSVILLTSTYLFWLEGPMYWYCSMGYFMYFWITGSDIGSWGIDLEWEVATVLCFIALWYHLLVDSWIIYYAIGGRNKNWFPRFKKTGRICMVIIFLVYIVSLFSLYG